MAWLDDFELGVGDSGEAQTLSIASCLGKKHRTPQRQRPHNHIPRLQGGPLHLHILLFACTHLCKEGSYRAQSLCCVLGNLGWCSRHGRVHLGAAVRRGTSTLHSDICPPHLTFTSSVTRSTTVFDPALLSLAMGKASSGTTKSSQIRRLAFISCTTEIQL